MNTERDNILNAIRCNLGRGELSAQSRATLDRRLTGATESLRPRLPGSDPVALFRDGLERLSGSLEELTSLREVPAAVAGYLREQDHDAAIVVAPALQSLDWAREELAPRFDRAHGNELTGVSQAFCGIAETGSLVLLSGPDNPTTINFLPEHHLVVLIQSDLLHHIEDVWSRMRASGHEWPRTVNIITGPSRTADIEQTIQLGAHGPRRLHVLLVNRQP